MVELSFKHSGSTWQTLEWWLPIYIHLEILQKYGMSHEECPDCPGGGGGHLRKYLGGAYARYQNLKIPLKHWFLTKKAPLFLKKTLTFYSKKHPFLNQKTDIGWTCTRILT